MAPAGPGPDAGQLAAMLRDRLESLCDALLPGGRREGGEYRIDGPDGAKWSICLRGAKRGVWASWGDDRHRGDPLELVRWTVGNGDRKLAWRWACDWLGERRSGATGSASRAPLPRSVPGPAERAAADAARQDAVRRIALGLYLAAVPIAGTPAEAYLAGRGITRELFASHETLGALRFVPTLRHPSGGEHPAMLAAIIDPVAGKHLATHRTYLARDAGGGWRKAALRPAKMVLGAYGGGVIPLLRGASGRPLRAAPAGDTVVIGEGIENTLCAALLYPEARALAAVSVGNLPHIALPTALHSVVLIEDRDGENDGPRLARAAAIARWLDEDRGISRWLPPEGFGDANDFWQAMRGADELRALGAA